MTEPVTLVTCSGLSNTGKLTARAGMLVDRVLALDGCEDTCALKKLREIGVEPDLHVVATGCGIVKNGMAEPRFDEIERLAGAVIEAIRGRSE